MSAPDFADFGRPQSAATPGMVVCRDCRKEVAKAQSQFIPRETGYICKDCAASRRRKFWAAIGSGALVVTAAIVWMILKFGSAIAGR
jgi:hypothetical protein